MLPKWGIVAPEPSLSGDILGCLWTELKKLPFGAAFAQVCVKTGSKLKFPEADFRSYPVKQGASMRETLFSSTEGRFLGVGLTLSGLMLLAFGVGWHLFPDRVLIYAAMTGLNLVIGRAAGMSFGYANALGHARVIPLNMLVETIQVLVVYPLFALSWRQLIKLPTLQPYLSRLHGAAESRSDVVQKFGIAGLFVFVFAPFWMTGPVVGAIIGFLIGLRPLTNLLVVLSATYVAIGVWGLLLNELNAWATTFNRFALFAFVLAIVLIVAAINSLTRHRGRPAKNLRK